MSEARHTVTGARGEQLELLILPSEIRVGEEHFSPHDLYGFELRKESRNERMFVFICMLAAMFAGSRWGAPVAVVAVVSLVVWAVRTRSRRSRWVVARVRGGGPERYLFRTETASEAEDLVRSIQDAKSQSNLD